MLQRWNGLNRALWFVIALIVLVHLGARMKTHELPGQTDIVPGMYHQPEQTPTSLAPFTRDFSGHRYAITPLYHYELTGLVVSQSELAREWFNINFKNDPFNEKDLCVVYGGNIVRETYKVVEFYSEISTCYATVLKRGTPYNSDDLSNNHILPATPEIAATLDAIEVGDQISFRGSLVAYTTEGMKERRSSTVRTDDGCEVVYVTNLEILKVANPVWRFIRDTSKYLLFLAVLVKIGAFVRV